MAAVTSGELKTNTTYDSYFWVRWYQANQYTEHNQTEIGYSCGVYCGHSFYSNAIKMSGVYINDALVYGGGTYSNFSVGDHTLASGTLWITHDTDGKKTFSISSFTGWLYENHNYSCGGDRFELTQIPRQATLTSAPDFTDLDNPTIYFSNPAGNAVSSLDACISFTGSRDDIPYRPIEKTGSSYKFELSDAERDTLRWNTVNSRKVYFYVRTGIGGVTYYSTQEKTLTIAESDTIKPVLWMTTNLNNGSLPSKFDGMYIQGKSRLDVGMFGEGRYGASITSFSAEIYGKTYWFAAPQGGNVTTDVLHYNTSLIGRGTDSRGFSNSTTKEIYVTPYSKPWIAPISAENAILCYRSDGNGNRIGNSTSVWIKAKRGYYSLSGKNTCALQWRSKPSTVGWDSSHEWIDLIPGTNTSTDEYNAAVSGNFELQKSYTVQIMAIDDIGEYDIKTFDIPTQDVALHLGKGGKNVSVGSYCDYTEPYTFHSEWKAIFDNGLFGTALNHNVTDVLEFGEHCTDGITPIIINSSTNKANLPEGDYAYSVGIVHKRAADQYNVILMDYVSGKIAINVHLSGTWTGWKYIVPQ